MTPSFTNDLIYLLMISIKTLGNLISFIIENGIRNSLNDQSVGPRRVDIDFPPSFFKRKNHSKKK